MKSGVIPVCLKPDIMPEYMIERDENGVGIKAVENAGIWSENYYDLPVLLGDTLIKFLDDSIPQETYDVMSNIAAKYNQNDSESKLVEIYSNQINKRINLFEAALLPAEPEVQPEAPTKK